MTDLDLALSLFNVNVFQQAKNNITELQYYFDTNGATCGNRLISELVNAIKDYSFDQIDLPLFNSIMARCGKTPAEGTKIINDIIRWKSYDKKQMEPSKKFIDDIVANSIITRANKLYQEHPSEYLKYLKNVNYKATNTDVFSATSFNNLDINSVINHQLVDGVSSSFDFINQSFRPYCKYEYGQLVLFSAPPGVGKTMWAFAEALHMAIEGKRVLYTALGDIGPADFITRMCAIYSGLPFWKVKENLATIYNGLCQMVGDNLNISIQPSGTITADDYIDYVMDKDYEILFIDYDSNFKSNVANENMYLVYGEIYDKLTKLTLAGKLVFILSQPQKFVWKNEVIDMSEVGESARKVHGSDLVITRGRVAGNPNHLGKFKIAKNRRGEEGYEVGSIRLNNGRFIILPDEVYEQLKRETTKRDYTEADINAMIAQYNRIHTNINRQINQAAQQYGGGQPISGPTPFGRP